MLNKQQLNKLYQYSYSLTNDPDNAYDLLQTGLEKYLSKSTHETSPNITHEIAYIRKIIRNQFIDDQRRLKCISFESIESDKHQDTLAMDTLSLDQIIIAQEEAQIVWDILSTSEREVIYLWAIEGYTAKQISDDTGVPRGTILSRIHRLKQKIIKVFEKNEQSLKEVNHEA